MKTLTSSSLPVRATLLLLVGAALGIAAASCGSDSNSGSGGGATGGSSSDGGGTGGSSKEGGTGGTSKEGGTGGTSKEGGTGGTGGTAKGGAGGIGGSSVGGSSTGGSSTGGSSTGGSSTGGSSTGGSSTGGSSTGGSSTGGSSTGGSSTGGSATGGGGSGGTVIVPNPLTDPKDGPPAGNQNPEATCTVPADAGLANVSTPTTVVGNGTAASCTSAAVVAAVANGGVITFNCGTEPVTIMMEQTAKIFNDKGPEIVIDGGGLVSLSGMGNRRILYMNTCDPNQVWTTSHCQDQDHPRLTLQNITFVDASSKTESEFDGGGAVWIRGGRVKVINARFFNNVCASEGPDVGGAALRVFSQFSGLPVYLVNTTFGGKTGYGGTGSNGGGISSIGVSWTIINSLFSYNKAIGNGGNPPGPGTPGGGSGGAIYNDGDTMTLSLCGTRIEYNEVVAFGSAIFFVSNDHTGDIRIDKSVITNNVGGSWYPTYPQISNHADTPVVVTNSTIQ